MSIMAGIAPMERAAGFDTIWFAVYVMIVNEMVQITPPIGLKLFALRGETGRDVALSTTAGSAPV